MAVFSRLLLVLGVCLGAIGAAGFGDEVEAEAWPLYVLGIVACLAGGLLLRRDLRRRATEGGAEGVSRAALAEALAGLAREVTDLAEAREALDREVFCERIDALLAGPCFEIGSRSEDYARLLGPTDYAETWEGFATCERLLSRAWSIATDDHLEEARAELPRAREAIRTAAERAASGRTP